MKKVSVSSAEWEVMRVVWAHSEVKSRAVIDALSEEMNWQPATIKTLLGRLVKKHVLSVTKDGNRNVYRSNVTEKELIEARADELFDMICDHKAVDLIKYLIDTKPLSRGAIKKLQDSLSQKMEKAPERIKCHCISGQCCCQSELLS